MAACRVTVEASCVDSLYISGIVKIGRESKESAPDCHFEQGLAVGGVVAVLAGVVGASVPTIALGLAGIAGLALAYLGGRDLLVGDRVRLGSVAMVGGVGVAAALVGAVAASDPVPALGASTVGAGVFTSGFLLPIVVWEYGRRRLVRDTGPANGTAG